MLEHKKTLLNIFFVLIGLILLFELIRSGQRDGDFIGYVQAGNRVLLKKHLYVSIGLNTWPPLFSVFCVPLALGDSISSFGIRILWNLGSLLAMIFSMQLSYRMITGTGISLKANQANYYQLGIVIFPILIILRYVLDNMANLQINMYMLLMALLSIHFFIKGKYAWVGLFLALSISLKIYTIFLLFYFIYKRAFRPVLWTFFFILFFNGITALLFGWEEAMGYYHYWANEVAPKSIKVQHKNQSLFGMFLRFFTNGDLGNGLHVNILSLDPKSVTKSIYVVVALASTYPAYLFRKKLKDKGSIASHLEYAFIFAAIPLLSPLAWKYYFIFLWPAYFLSYYLLYQQSLPFAQKTIVWLKRFFLLSILLTVFSTELFTGRYFSDVLESYSVVTFGALILLGIVLRLYTGLAKKDLSSIKR